LGPSSSTTPEAKGRAWNPLPHPDQGPRPLKGNRKGGYPTRGSRRIWALLAMHRALGAGGGAKEGRVPITYDCPKRGLRGAWTPFSHSSVAWGGYGFRGRGGAKEGRVPITYDCPKRGFRGGWTPFPHSSVAWGGYGSLHTPHSVALEPPSPLSHSTLGLSWG